MGTEEMSYNLYEFTPFLCDKPRRATYTCDIHAAVCALAQDTHEIIHIEWCHKEHVGDEVRRLNKLGVPSVVYPVEHRHGNWFTFGIDRQ